MLFDAAVAAVELPRRRRIGGESLPKKQRMAGDRSALEAFRTESNRIGADKEKKRNRM